MGERAARHAGCPPELDRRIRELSPLRVPGAFGGGGAVRAEGPVGRLRRAARAGHGAGAGGGGDCASRRTERWPGASASERSEPNRESEQDMAIYMKVEGVKGRVTATGYEDHIEVE